MRLSCQKAFLFTVSLTMACHESTAPLAFPAGFYVLESINGQSLPAIIYAKDGDTTTVFWSTLTLDVFGNATYVERVRHVHPNTPATEATFTTGYVYTASEHSVTGFDLSFDYSPPCPPNALCIGPPVGRIVGSALVLTPAGDPPFSPPYLYRRAGLD